MNQDAVTLQLISHQSSRSEVRTRFDLCSSFTISATLWENGDQLSAGAAIMHRRKTGHGPVLQPSYECKSLTQVTQVIAAELAAALCTCRKLRGTAEVVYFTRETYIFCVCLKISGLCVLLFYSVYQKSATKM